MAKRGNFRDLMARRKYYRVLRQLRVRYHVPRLGHSDLPGRTVDLGLGGARLHVPHQLPLGETMELILAEGKDGEDIVLSGKVSWAVWNESARSYEVGLQFPPLTSSQRAVALDIMGCGGKTAGEQRRRYVRVKKKLTVELRESLLAKRLLAEVLDIGPGGMAVETDRHCKKDVVCCAKIFVPGADEPACVRTRILGLHKRPDGKRWMMRLRFEVFEGSARETLRRFLGAEVDRPPG